MRPFTYRFPRFLADATFQFQMEEVTLPGVCTDVSLGGVRALIEESGPPVGKAGSLLLCYAQQQFALGAVVTHVEGKEVGFTFVQRNEGERTAAADFGAFLEAQTPRSIVRHVS